MGCTRKSVTVYLPGPWMHTYVRYSIPTRTPGPGASIDSPLDVKGCPLTTPCGSRYTPGNSQRVRWSSPGPMPSTSSIPGSVTIEAECSSNLMCVLQVTGGCNIFQLQKVNWFSLARPEIASRGLRGRTNTRHPRLHPRASLRIEHNKPAQTRDRDASRLESL